MNHIRSPISSGAIDDLRSENEDKEYLIKNNFDLKMKVYYLEENLRKIKENGSSNSLMGVNMEYVEELKTNNLNLKLQLDEKVIEMEQRNSLLIKAKTAIETLKSEINRLRSEANSDSNKSSDMEQKLRNLVRSNEETESKQRMRIEQLEMQIMTLQQALSLKEHTTSNSEEKLVLINLPS
jgi:hypothetical protein